MIEMMSNFVWLFDITVKLQRFLNFSDTHCSIGLQLEGIRDKRYYFNENLEKWWSGRDGSCDAVALVDTDGHTTVTALVWLSCDCRWANRSVDGPEVDTTVQHTIQSQTHMESVAQVLLMDAMTTDIVSKTNRHWISTDKWLRNKRRHHLKSRKAVSK